MDDLMSKSKFKEALISCQGLGRKSIEAVLKTMDEQPTIEAVPVVHGEWIKEMGAFFPRYICSACREKYGAEWYRHCPSCGAKMKAKKGFKYGKVFNL